MSDEKLGGRLRELFRELRCKVGWHQWSKDPDLGYETHPVYMCDRCAKIKT